MNGNVWSTLESKLYENFSSTEFLHKFLQRSNLLTFYSNVEKAINSFSYKGTTLLIPNTNNYSKLHYDGILGTIVLTEAFRRLNLKPIILTASQNISSIVQVIKFLNYKILNENHSANGIFLLPFTHNIVEAEIKILKIFSKYKFSIIFHIAYMEVKNHANA